MDNEAGHKSVRGMTALLGLCEREMESTQYLAVSSSIPKNFKVGPFTSFKFHKYNCMAMCKSKYPLLTCFQCYYKCAWLFKVKKLSCR